MLLSLPCVRQQGCFNALFSCLLFPRVPGIVLQQTQGDYAPATGASAARVPAQLPSRQGSSGGLGSKAGYGVPRPAVSQVSTDIAFLWFCIRVLQRQAWQVQNGRFSGTRCQSCRRRLQRRLGRRLLQGGQDRGPFQRHLGMRTALNLCCRLVP